jgi:hypothetical protein
LLGNFQPLDVRLTSHLLIHVVRNYHGSAGCDYDKSCEIKATLVESGSDFSADVEGPSNGILIGRFRNVSGEPATSHFCGCGAQVAGHSRRRRIEPGWPMITALPEQSIPMNVGPLICESNPMR